jgi:anti-sigma regulatory factor (Ser/Thr protein kinase)
MSAQARVASYRHEAMLWRGVDDFLAGCVPFIREGIAAEEPVMVASTRERVGLLQESLGTDADAVRFVDMEELGANPARIIPAWASFVRDAGGRASRGIGEPIWAGRSPAEIAECQLHERLLNLALTEDTPLWLRCPYDVEGLPGAVIDEAERSHPAVTDTSQASTRTQPYAGPGHAWSAFTSPLPEPPSVQVVVEFGEGDLRRVREAVVLSAERCGVPIDRVADLALAVHELAANSVVHGGGHGVLRIWCEARALLCEVADRGQVLDPLTGRHQVGPEGASGRGLWMVNHLCDLVQLRSSGSGTVVRVHTWT